MIPISLIKKLKLREDEELCQVTDRDNNVIVHTFKLRMPDPTVHTWSSFYHSQNMKTLFLFANQCNVSMFEMSRRTYLPLPLPNSGIAHSQSEDSRLLQRHLFLQFLPPGLPSLGWVPLANSWFHLVGVQEWSITQRNRL